MLLVKREEVKPPQGGRERGGLAQQLTRALLEDGLGLAVCLTSSGAHVQGNTENMDDKEDSSHLMEWIPLWFHIRHASGLDSGDGQWVEAVPSRFSVPCITGHCPQVGCGRREEVLSTRR